MTPSRMPTPRTPAPSLSMSLWICMRTRAQADENHHWIAHCGSAGVRVWLR
jgi:hypothetical protein